MFGVLAVEAFRGGLGGVGGLGGWDPLLGGDFFECLVGSVAVSVSLVSSSLDAVLFSVVWFVDVVLVEAVVVVGIGVAA